MCAAQKSPFSLLALFSRWSRILPVFLILLLGRNYGSTTTDTDLPIDILPRAALTADAPKGGDFSKAFHLKVDFSSPEQIDAFIGKSFTPVVSNWARGEHLKAWIFVEGDASLFDGRIRAYSEGRFIDIPLVVKPEDFGNWRLLTIDIPEANETTFDPLIFVETVYFYTSRNWNGSDANLNVYLAELKLTD